MQITRKINGVVPVVQSFFCNGKIDKLSTQKHIKFLISKKIGGLWTLGTGSEDMNISFEKRVQIAKIISETNDNKIPLILGASFFALDDIISFIRRVGKFRFDAFHVMPYHPLLSLKQLEYFYKKIVDITMSEFNKPWWLYTSENWSRKVDYDFINRLSKVKGICGIKYSTSNAPDQLRVIGLASSNFQVITAVAKQFFLNLSMGASAGTTSLAGALPEPVIDIYLNYKKKRLNAALKCQRKLNKFLNAIPSSLKKDNFLAAAEEKYILSLRGIGNGEVSNYYRSPTKTEKIKIKKSFFKLKKDFPNLKSFKTK